MISALRVLLDAPPQNGGAAEAEVGGVTAEVARRTYHATVPVEGHAARGVRVQGVEIPAGGAYYLV